MECPYCKAEVKLESTVKIYGKDYGLAFICSNYPKCDAYVGVHKKNNKPLGRLANKELRTWKSNVHRLFDPLWERKMKKDSLTKGHARGKAYKWLAGQLNIDIKDCHVGMFDVETCKRAVEILKQYSKH